MSESDPDDGHQASLITGKSSHKHLNHKREFIHDSIVRGTRENEPLLGWGDFLSMNTIRDFWHDLSWDLRCALRDLRVRLSSAFR
ncbi:MAG: hypothetical protein JO055_07490 [Alphaproteobacteria bacterium]|nr:hypothetical protein [Alphaproteobacteria bacterium]